MAAANQSKPPPWRWHADTQLSSPIQQQSQPITNVETVAAAWKNVTNVVRDDWRPVQLIDLLTNAVRETQYSFQPAGWPSLLRARMPMLNEMPQLVLDRYNACQTVCFCGVFPQIRRAWASVDNSLFLWRFDRWNDVPIEYCGEEQAIVAVGLATPKPHVFVEAIQHILVICTTVEVVLLGVCNTGGDDDIALQPLPLYAIASDNVTMTCVATTPSGRIFLGGADGHVYELLYSANDSWRQKRCTKLCLTGGLRHMLPPFLPSLLFGTPTPIIQLVADPTRHILYALSQSSALHAFDLGADGTDTARRVGEVTDFVDAASRAAGGREAFGRADKRIGVLRMDVVPLQECHRVALVTITTDGRRVYWSVLEPRAAASRDAAGLRPTTLRAELVRAPVPGGAGMTGVASQRTTARLGDLSCAAYAQGVLLLAESGGSRTRIVSASRDMGVPPLGTATGPHAAALGLREVLSDLDVAIPGDACALVPVPLTTPFDTLGTLALHDELHTQVVLPAPRFVLVSTAGVLEVDKLRPVDVLQVLLEERATVKVEAFFDTYGAHEAAAMAMQLAASVPGAVSLSVVAAARAALDSPQLIGEPRPLEDATNQQQLADADPATTTTTTTSAFDMGAALPVAEPIWSAAHRGLCLFISRLLHPVWEVSLVKTSGSVLGAVLDVMVLIDLEARLRSLASFLEEYVAQRSRRRGGVEDAGLVFGQGQGVAKRLKLDAAHAQETKRNAGVLALARRAAEACFLLRILSESNLPRLAARCSEGIRSRLTALKFRDLVTSSEGEGVAAQLVSTLVGQHMTSVGGRTEDLAGLLQSGCPSFFKEEDKLYYSATTLLQRAEAATGAADRDDLAHQAVALMSKVPLSVDLVQVVPQLVYLRDVEGMVDLALRKAEAMDPHNVAAQQGTSEGDLARQQRIDLCYGPLLNVLRWLIDPSSTSAHGATVPLEGLSDEQRGVLKSRLLKRVGSAGTKDHVFLEVWYRCLADANAIRDLLALDDGGSHLQTFLTAAAGLAGANGQVGPLTKEQVSYGQLLARLFVQRSDFASAAAVYEIMGSRKHGPGDQTVTLAERASLFRQAHLQAQSQGDAVLVDRLAGQLHVLELQQATLEALQHLDRDGDEWQAQLGELRDELQGLAVLYNEYAARFKLWSLCLEMINVSEYGDTAYVRQLWDLFLHDQLARTPTPLATACASVADLGHRFFPNDAALPLPHVALRLEQIAANEWGGNNVVDDSDSPETMVPRALLQACRGNHEVVLRCYAQLLSDRQLGALQGPRMRTRVLRSLLAACRAAVEAGPDQRRVVGVVAEVAQQFASDARRLPGDAAQDIAVGLEAVVGLGGAGGFGAGGGQWQVL